MFRGGDLCRTTYGTIESDKQRIVEHAVTAMEELVRMAHAGEPLWLPGHDQSTELLNREDYFQAFPRGIEEKPMDCKAEASRETAIVPMNQINLVEILMDLDRWSKVFSGVVSRASTLEVFSNGVTENYNGTLQVMTAEFHVLSPVVPPREVFFVRYCKKHAEGTWAVVDVSLDHLRSAPIMRCRRRPSGCFIQEMPNGYSKVTWVEHVEVEDKGIHNFYETMVDFGLAFGAKLWIAALDRQSERLASIRDCNIHPGDIGVLTGIDGREGMLKLAERMVISFCSVVCASTPHSWTILSGTGYDDVRVMTRKSVDDPGRPRGIVLIAATSFWLPVLPKRLFDFLHNVNYRNQWDIFTNGGLVQEMVRIGNGRDPGNCVSLLRAHSANTSQSHMLVIQESSTHLTGSLVTYAPVHASAMNMVLTGGDPDNVDLLPSGFAILPCRQPHHGDGVAEVGAGGSLLTVAFQVLVNSDPTGKVTIGSVADVNQMIAWTVERIKDAIIIYNA